MTLKPQASTSKNAFYLTAEWQNNIRLKASNGETFDDPIILIVIETKHNPLNYIKS